MTTPVPTHPTVAWVTIDAVGNFALETRVPTSDLASTLRRIADEIEDADV